MTSPEEITELLMAWLAERARRRPAGYRSSVRSSRSPGRYNYPDQSIATMTPEQAGEVVESFCMEMAEAERDGRGS